MQLVQLAQLHLIAVDALFGVDLVQLVQVKVKTLQITGLLEQQFINQDIIGQVHSFALHAFNQQQE